MNGEREKAGRRLITPAVVSDPERMTATEFLADFVATPEHPARHRTLQRILNDAYDARKAEDRAGEDLKTILRLVDLIDRLGLALDAAKGTRTEAARTARAAAADALAIEARRMKANGATVAQIAEAIERTPRRVSTLLKRPVPRKS
jgi:hypothetical protein